MSVDNPTKKVKTPEDDVRTIPIIPLPGKVIFPNTTTPLNVVRESGVLAAKHALRNDGSLLLLNQKDSDADPPTFDELYNVGTIADISDSYDPHDGTVRVAIASKSRAIVLSKFMKFGFMFAKIQVVSNRSTKSKETTPLMGRVTKLFEQYLRAKKQSTAEALTVARRQKEPGYLADYVASYTDMSADRLQKVLDEIDPTKRLEVLIELLKGEIELSSLDKKIESRVKKSIEKTHREFYLHEKMKVIQKELGRDVGDASDLESLREKITKIGMNEEGIEKASKEVDRLQQMPPMSAESGIIRTYIDWLVSLPWDKRTESTFDIDQALTILDEDHYGLEEPKERILEYLAVMKLVKKIQGPILCLVGPPGVGKTSLGKSIARSTDRNFVRMSLGGVRDEAEIRGHRRTYIGSMPGRIIQGIRDAKSKNPLFLLDEIDKMSNDFRGDPAAALLEVLDPEQNDSFRDHYLDVSFDLSEVMFITTANSIVSIPVPLRDRMEVIELPGYTEYEKRKIASHFLIPKQLEKHGLKDRDVQFTENAVSETIDKYTREAGVRHLERELSKVCRKVAKKIATDREEFKGSKIDFDNLKDYLGVPKFTRRRAEDKDVVGVATGLVYTQIGGDLISIEATTTPTVDKGGLALTGQLGDVMKESAQVALAYIRSRHELLELPINFNFDKNRIHIHVPEGAVPKEGPSAGITLATAMISALTGKKVRRDVAMTGEITLRGRVLPIGGLKEKVLAAHRNKIDNIIVPEENDKDLSEIPEDVRNAIHFHKVGTMNQVLDLALKK